MPPEKRAWHAGVSCWKGREKCNDYSIGIELEGADDVPFAEPQYEALARLSRELHERFAPLDIAGHSDVAPGTKTEPGGGFAWQRLVRALSCRR